MKVPHAVVGRTRPSGQGLGYLSAAGATPAAFGAGIGDAIASFGGALAAEQERERARLEQREEQTQRYQTLTNFGEFETSVQTRLEELRRNGPPSGAGYAKAAEALYAQEEARFLNSQVPADLRDEFTFRSGQVKQGIVRKALDFQYEAGDEFFRQGVKDAINKAKTNLDPATGGSPDNLEAEKASVFANIDTTDLSSAEKQELKRLTAMSLEAVGYKTEVAREAARRPSRHIPENIGLIIDAAAERYGVPPEYLRTIAALESGGNPNAKNPKSSAGGLFQFIDSTAAQYGLSNKFDASESADAGARLLRDNMEGLRRVLGREPTVGEVYLAHQQGLGGATSLLRNPDRLATDIVGVDAVRLNGGAPGMTAAQFVALWDKKASGGVAGGTSLDDDPRYANVPYEDRLALRADAQREIEAALAAQAALDKATREAAINAMKHGIEDGTVGQADIDAAVENGTLADFSDRKAVQDQLDKKTADVRLASDAMAALQSDAFVWDPSSEKHQKMQNALIGDDGVARIAAMDAGYFNSWVIPNATRTGDIASSTIGTLSGMVRSNDQTKALWALDALRQLEAADPRAFDQRTNDKLARDVAFYSARRNSLPADELMAKINPMVDQKTRQANELLYAEGKEYLNGSKGGITNLSTRISEVIDAFDTITTSPNVSSYAPAAKGLDLEYQAVFLDNYVMYGNADDAHKATVKELQKTWGVSSVGGRSVLMRNPPEKSGYRPLSGDYDWITPAARTEFAIPEGNEFELISDDQTKDELDRFKAGLSTTPPSYMAVWYDANNVPRVVMDGKLPARRYFEPSAADKLREVQEFERQKLEYEYNEFRKKFRDVQFESLRQGLPVPEEYFEEDIEFRKKLNLSVPTGALQQGITEVTPEQRTVPMEDDSQIMVVP